MPKIIERYEAWGRRRPFWFVLSVIFISGATVSLLYYLAIFVVPPINDLLTTPPDQFLQKLSALTQIFTLIVLAATAAIAAIYYERSVRISKSKNSLELIYRQVHDRDVIEVFDAYRAIKTRYPGGLKYHQIMKDYKKAQKKAYCDGGNPDLANRHDLNYLVQLLNYYESWSIGVDSKALDEPMMIQWWRSSLVRHWRELFDFVETYREERRAPHAFTGVQRLAERWANENQRALF